MKRINLIMLMIASTMMMSCKQDNKIAGHEYVDLGLPSGLKWATCNVGADNPEDYGNYYAWGEAVTENEYTEDDSLIFEFSYSDLRAKGIIDENNSLASSYDAAAVNWGGSWRIPTGAECEELLTNCTWEWTAQNGVDGCRVTSKTNGNSIFLPAAGYLDRSLLKGVGTYGYYWSFYPEFCGDFMCGLYFGNDEPGMVVQEGFCCRSVRPVSE